MRQITQLQEQNRILNTINNKNLLKLEHANKIARRAEKKATKLEAELMSYRLKLNRLSSCFLQANVVQFELVQGKLIEGNNEIETISPREAK